MFFSLVFLNLDLDLDLDLVPRWRARPNATYLRRFFRFFE